MENDVAMWACLNALDFSVYRGEFVEVSRVSTRC